MARNDIRAEFVTLSRLFDIREPGSIPAILTGNPEPHEQEAAAGQAVEAACHVLEEFFVDVHRIADALERMAKAQEDVVLAHVEAASGTGN